MASEKTAALIALEEQPKEKESTTPKALIRNNFFHRKSALITCIFLLLIILNTVLLLVIIIGSHIKSKDESQQVHYNAENYQEPSEIFELRIYNIYAQNFSDTLKLFEEMSLHRNLFSKVLGCWTGEIGASINQIVQIEQYDHLDHRKKVQGELSNNIRWLTGFMRYLLPSVQSWTNALMAPVPHSQINTTFDSSSEALYRLEILKGYKAAPSKSKDGNEVLVGRFLGVFGSTNTEYRLWRYSSIHHLQASSWKKILSNPEDGTSLLLYPTKFSALR
ncbi:uncharacterized protein LOC131953258 [Physella acuta]|uniref:uncharacterized protein LOC131953258 n=1 Tax=Physella acuta TaxID=109671 RepID=UPI0027DD8BA7|nr:uncharacterized protein LOC131953258 [Physella acuta]